MSPPARSSVRAVEDGKERDMTVLKRKRLLR